MNLQRIVVAVDASPHSLAALEAASLLAAMHRAQLVGVFIEDIDLLRLAGLPFAREMIYPHVLGRQIEVPMMEERLKELAESARQAVSQCALRTGVNWLFHVRRGAVVAELVKTTDESDLLVIGKASHIEKRRRVRLGTTAANLLSRAPCPVLALQHGEICHGPAMLVTDGSEESLERLPAAVNFARMFNGKPIILLLAWSRDEAAVLKENIQSSCGLEDVRVRRCSPAEKGGLVRVAHEEDAGVVFLVGIPLKAQSEEIPEMLSKLDCPVLAYR